MQDNKLSILPKEITELKAVQWKLAGNPFLCNCDMLWMRDWLSDTFLHSNRQIVEDFQDVLCHGGQFNRQPVYKVSADKMGCLPHIFAREAIISLASILSVGLIILCLISFAIKRWNEVRWIIYKGTNRFIGKGEEEEDLENVVFDAFIAYR